MANHFMGRQTISAAYLARIGVLSAIAAVLYEFPKIPIIQPIYKLDFSGIPALLAGFSMGPLAGLLVALIKDLIGLFHSSSMGVGELADFLVLGTFVAVSSIIYLRRCNFKAALWGMLWGIAAMVVVGALANYYIMIPFYMGAYQMNEGAIIGLVSKTIPQVTSMWRLILLATVPFNLIKGAALCVATLLVYKRLSPLLRGK